MKFQQRYALGFLLAATASLAACDYQKGPGKDPQASENFNLEAAPEATSNEIARDSVNRVQNVQPPAGIGSAADQQQSTDNALNSAPGGNTASSPQSASGEPASVGKTQDGNSRNASQAPSQASGTDQSGNGTTSGGGSTGGGGMGGGGSTTQR